MSRGALSPDVLDRVRRPSIHLPRSIRPTTGNMLLATWELSKLGGGGCVWWCKQVGAETRQSIGCVRQAEKDSV